MYKKTRTAKRPQTKRMLRLCLAAEARGLFYRMLETVRFLLFDRDTHHNTHKTCHHIILLFACCVCEIIEVREGTWEAQRCDPTAFYLAGAQKGPIHRVQNREGKHHLSTLRRRRHSLRVGC